MRPTSASAIRPHFLYPRIDPADNAVASIGCKHEPWPEYDYFQRGVRLSFFPVPDSECLPGRGDSRQTRTKTGMSRLLTKEVKVETDGKLYARN